MTPELLAHQLGDVNIQRIIEIYDGPFLTPKEFFPAATGEAIDAKRSLFEPHALCPKTGKLILPVQSYLVKTEHHTILIDTCIGCRKTIGFFDSWNDRRDTTWLNNLAAAGAQPEDIDYVFCSHLHIDHCGWNTQLIDGRWVPTFPNAKYVFSKAELEATEAGNSDSYRESVLPILDAGQAQIVDSDYALDDQIWLHPTPGHTAGHVAINLASNGHHAVMCGDLMHSPVQLTYPDWSTRVDVDRDEARRTRHSFLDQYAETKSVVLTAHFPSPSMGRIVRDDDAYGINYL